MAAAWAGVWRTVAFWSAFGVTRIDVVGVDGVVGVIRTDNVDGVPDRVGVMRIVVAFVGALVTNVGVLRPSVVVEDNVVPGVFRNVTLASCFAGGTTGVIRLMTGVVVSDCTITGVLSLEFVVLSDTWSMLTGDAGVLLRAAS